MVKKLVCGLLIAASIITVMPIGVSAEWKSDNSGWWYVDGGDYYTGWKQIDNKWYNFGSNGYMKTGWIRDGLSWYYLQVNGVMVTDQATVGGKLYQFDSNGKWINIYYATSYTNSSALVTLQDKLKVAPNFSWVTDNVNKYFKTRNAGFLRGVWNIDGYEYVFDNNGVMQKGEYTSKGGIKYLLGYDGKYIKCLTDNISKLVGGGAVTTKSTSDNSVVTLDDSHMMDITNIFSRDSSKSGANAQGVKVEGKTLYCRTNQSVELGTIKVSGTDANSSSFPNLIIKSDRSDKDVAFSGVSTSLEDGFLKNVHLVIYAHKVGKTTVTIDVNGTKTSFDVVVTE